MQRYLFNDSYNNEDLVWSYEYASKARTFIIGYKQGIFFLKCYSDNLHLYQSRSKPETLKLDFTKKTDGLFSALLLHQRVIEPFYPIDGPQVFVAIHSPYVPINFEDLHAIIPGKEYSKWSDPTGYVYENGSQLSSAAELFSTIEYKWYKAILEKN
ncbi:hypothetical protein AVEN_49587-1 [Araneus ventricosus]|uniref:Uncharacterized protein n=1 Tax=Araneus ventricosus TaxID=182803 RepID=A0A4Y2LUS8_ARAVE|nr:hypothetical protein AVEN_49587-1 [Araneus ventricosus]